MGLLDDAIREHLDLKRQRGADPAEVEKLEREALGPVRRDPMAGERLAADAPPGALMSDDELHEGVEDFEHVRAEIETPEPDLAAPGVGDPGLASADLADPGFPLDHEPEFHAEPVGEPEHGLAPDDSHGKKNRLGFLRRSHKDEPQNSGFGDEDLHDDPFFQDDPHATRAMPATPAAPQPPPSVPTPLSEDPAPAADFELHDEHEFDDTPEGALPEMPPRLPIETNPPPPRDAPPLSGEPLDAEPGATIEYDVESAFTEEDVLEETPEFLSDTPDHDRLWFEQKPPRDFDFE